ALFTSAEGRVARQPFWLSLLVLYAAGFASQVLLGPEVTTRAGVWAFVAAQAGLIWAWACLHIKRSRDAGQGPGTAIAVAVVYALAVGLLVMLIAFLTNPNAPSSSDGRAASDFGWGLVVIAIIFGLLFAPDFGTFMTILKILVFIAFLPVLISAAFSIW